jgi:hypothetical protein
MTLHCPPPADQPPVHLPKASMQVSVCWFSTRIASRVQVEQWVQAAVARALQGLRSCLTEYAG